MVMITAIKGTNKTVLSNPLWLPPPCDEDDEDDVQMHLFACIDHKNKKQLFAPFHHQGELIFDCEHFF